MKYLKYLKMNLSKMMPLFNKTFPENIIAFTSDRSVDFTCNGDQRAFNKTQRKFLFSQLNFDLPEPACIHQVHNNKIIVVGEPLYGEYDLKEADGLVTQVSSLPLAIRSADCLPVFLYDEMKCGIGLVHVGWKGSQKNIIGQAVRLMQEQWQANPKNIIVAFGPSIHSCCYQVGSEFQDLFGENCIMREGHYYLDLLRMTRDQLFLCGVSKANIFDCDICTCCEPDYFSFRREGGNTGRMISLMMIKK